MSKLTIGTRGSALALVQANWVATQLRASWPELEVEIRKISTTGDQRTGVTFAEAGGKGIFTREIDLAQTGGEVDIAVHSMKDVPTELAGGLIIACVPERENPQDAAVTRDGGPLEELAENAVVGTSSLRRQAWLRHWRPDLQVIEFRGNVGTRLRKLDEGQADATILAAAGMNRLEIDRPRELLPFSLMLPAPAQGALAITTRVDDGPTQGFLSPLNHEPTLRATAVERELLARLGGSCQIPFSAHAKVLGDGSLSLEAAACHPDGTRAIRGEATGPDGSALCDRVFTLLEEQGLADLMREINEILGLETRIPDNG